MKLHFFLISLPIAKVSANNMIFILIFRLTFSVASFSKWTIFSDKSTLIIEDIFFALSSSFSVRLTESILVKDLKTNCLKK